MAGSEAAKEAVYLRRFGEELGYVNLVPTRLGMDNQAGIAIAYNPEQHTKTKHIQRRHFFVRELVEENRISVPFVSTVDTMADFFTKPLKARKFFAMRDAIMDAACIDSTVSRSLRASSRRKSLVAPALRRDCISAPNS